MLALSDEKIEIMNALCVIKLDSVSMVSKGIKYPNA